MKEGERCALRRLGDRLDKDGGEGVLEVMPRQ
jgi:hypothetical protein